MMVATCISHDEAIFPKIIDHSGNLPSHCHIVHVQGAHRYHQMKTIRDIISNTKLLLSFPSVLLERKSVKVLLYKAMMLINELLKYKI